MNKLKEHGAAYYRDRAETLYGFDFGPYEIEIECQEYAEDDDIFSPGEMLLDFYGYCYKSYGRHGEVLDFVNDRLEHGLTLVEYLEAAKPLYKYNPKPEFEREPEYDDK